MIWLKALLMLAGAYLVGSIPMGYLVGKLFYKTDIRTAGSRNIGATNALRLFGTRTGIIILLLDMLKGFAVVILSKMLLGDYPWLVVLSGLVVILGHIFTIFLGFKGGKGVATAGGVFLALAPGELGLALLFFIIIVLITRYVSLGSILAAISFGIFVSLRQYFSPSPDWVKVAFTVVVVAMIIYKHKENIGRLIRASENKIRFTKKGSL